MLFLNLLIVQRTMKHACVDMKCSLYY